VIKKRGRELAVGPKIAALLVPDGNETLIVPNDPDHRNVVLHRSRDGTGHEEESAVANDSHNGSMGAASLAPRAPPTPKPMEAKPNSEGPSAARTQAIPGQPSCDGPRRR